MKKSPRITVGLSREIAWTGDGGTLLEKFQCCKCGEFFDPRDHGGTDDERGRQMRQLLCRSCADGPRDCETWGERRAKRCP
mgnify:CR=1 FL=1